MPETVVTKEYDWTYTTTYSGSWKQVDSFQPADPADPSHTIPLEELKRRDPILFFSEIPLFEDELHDNGSSHYTVRVVSNATKTNRLSIKHSTESHAIMFLHPGPICLASRQCPVPRP